MVPPLDDTPPGTPGSQVKKNHDYYYPEIDYIDFSFLSHPAYTGIEHLMNPTYGLNIKFTEILLDDGFNLSDSIAMIPNIKNSLILENICNNAFNTQDTSTIALLTNCFTLTAPFDNSKASKPLCTLNNLERTMQFFTKNTCSTASSLTYVPPTGVHNFKHFGQTSFPKPTTIPHAIPTTPNPAAATTTTTTNASNQQFLSLFNQQTSILQQQSKMLTNLNQSKTSPQTLHPYIPMKFDTVETVPGKLSGICLFL
eukprot:jgi/Psemu1/5830/gm1.5830_g